MGNTAGKVKRFDVVSARQWLAFAWMGFTALFFLIIVVQTVTGHYGDLALDVWNWYLPSVMPTVGFALAVVATDAILKPKETEEANGFMFWTSMGLTLVYFLVLGILLLNPKVVADPSQLLPIARISQVYLAPLQALVAAALAVFFAASPPMPVPPDN